MKYVFAVFVLLGFSQILFAETESYHTIKVAYDPNFIDFYGDREYISKEWNKEDKITVSSSADNSSEIVLKEGDCVQLTSAQFAKMTISWENPRLLGPDNAKQLHIPVFGHFSKQYLLYKIQDPHLDDPSIQNSYGFKILLTKTEDSTDCNQIKIL